jgi:hypothetical protein
MRDLVVREALEAMVRDAAKRFREQISSGGEIPYDIRESGDGSPLPQYTPLTERFIREHAPLLRELDSFGAACAAVESAELATPYLAQAGIDAPPEARRRAELAGILFLCRLWQDSTDFSLDGERLRTAISELEAGGDAGAGEIEIVVPLRGLRMEASKLELATATIVRADTVDVPPEARASEASGGAGWEPTFLAAATVTVEPESAGDEDGADPGTRSVDAFRTLITTLRLFKEGGVALGPHAWTRVAGGRWRRIATGAGRPRPGGYRLAESERGELAAFSKGIAARSPHHEGRGPLPGAVGRAVSRFEAGLERTAAVDALNDYLLALRFLLEGGGPADMGLGMRVASLCADPDGRSEVKRTIDRALALERELWSGEPAIGAEAHTPADTAAAVEELARAILKDAACGHLGADLRATADEILLADGLAVGDGAGSQRGETAEWGVSEGAGALVAEHRDASPAAPGREAEERAGTGWAEAVRGSGAEGEAEASAIDSHAEAPRYGREEPVVEPDLWFDGTDPDDDEAEVQVIRQPERIKLERRAPAEEESMIAKPDDTYDDEQPTRTVEPVPRGPVRSEGDNPVVRLLAIHSAEREATKSRVANLFPKPETTEWDVREVSYDRRRRARVAEGS